MTKPTFISRKVTIDDEKIIFDLYKKSSFIKEGLARTPDEITEDYIKNYTKKTVENGLGIIMFNENNQEVAVLLSHKNDPKTFAPMITNMSLAVDPNFIGQGIGKKIFTDYLDEIKTNHPEIKRVELNVRQTNQRAIEIYKSVGFVVEGIMKNRILDSKGNLSDDTMMAWYRV